MIKDIHIAVLYPCDPAGNVIGGVESFIRGQIKGAPNHIHFHIIGATTDEASRPVRRWTTCKIGSKTFKYYPLFSMGSSQRRQLIPLTVKYLMAGSLFMPDLKQFDVVEGHRIEQFLLLRKQSNPRNMFLHNTTSSVVLNKNSDIRWKWAPSLYIWLERLVVSKLSSLFIVREEGAKEYRERYADVSCQISFVPTPVDTDYFFPLPAKVRKEQRGSLCLDLGCSTEDCLIVFIGRLDTSKDPVLLLDAFQKAKQSDSSLRLLYVGDGVLRELLEKKAGESNLEDSVFFLGFKSPVEVANTLQLSDIFALSSAYEGMPIALSEAMSCGLPAVTTQVGEVSKLVRPDFNGEISPTRDAGDYAASLLKVVKNLNEYSGERCIEQARPYSPELTFSRVYKNYNDLTGDTLAEQANN